MLENFFTNEEEAWDSKDVTKQKDAQYTMDSVWATTKF